MSSIITRLFKGSCPAYPAGQTVTVTYDNNDHKVISTACPDENKCSTENCPVKVTISTMFN